MIILTGVFKWTISILRSVTSDGWVSLIGSALSFLGIFITINYTRKQFKEDKRIDVKPFLNIKLKSLENDICSLGFFKINSSNINKPSKEKVGVEFDNLGLGHCLKCKLVEVKLNNKNIQQEVCFIGNIKKSESITKGISLYVYYGDILEGFKNKYYGKKMLDYDDGFGNLENKIREYTKSRLELIIEYYDVLGNKYKKSWYLDVFIVFNIKTNEIFLIEDFEFERVEYEIEENSEKII
ncbi:MAG: hypothetical protein ACRCVJ_13180 [Clostridium sp.]|uniref:hypothetical protein n=1 Tax=Clostridium sp. TaxID=1506 RepID=UPI003F30CC8D